MNILIALDSFKESLSAADACAAVARGFRAIDPKADCHCLPMADGGEGTTAALVAARGGDWQTVTVQDPLGRPVTARYGRLPDGSAVMEMAEAAGLHYLAPGERNPRITSTYGVGEMLRHALDGSCTHIILGIGGSATNDGGAGMLQALGVRLLDADGGELPRGGAALARLHHADFSGLHPALANTTLEIACDVTNPLCGANGASAIFGPQKGADAATVAVLDAALAHYAAVLSASGLPDCREQPGAGAAGGLGYALALLGACLTSGEGRLDGQTRLGKVPLGVLRRAQKHNVPVIALAGVLGAGAETLTDAGFAAIFPSIAALAPLEETLAKGGENLERTARQIAAVLALGGRLQTPAILP